MSFIDPMSIHIFFCALILASTVFHYVTPQSSIREYVVRRDLFSGFKANEFSVHDKSEEHVHYRIESSYSVMQSLKVLAYPSKQEVGELSRKVNLLLYKAQLSILDSTTNQWINGTIRQKFQWFGTSFQIDLNGDKLTMETKFASLTTKFLDTSERVLAQFRLRPGSVLITRIYDLQVFTNKYPDQLYFLGLAAHRHDQKKGG